jgi:hypothetical protein
MIKTSICAFITCAAALAATCAVAGDESAGGRDSLQVNLACDLKDGSCVKGTPSIRTVSVRTDYAKLQLRLSSIRQLTVTSDHESVIIEMQNGDKISGVLDLPPFKLKTAFGVVELSIEHITKIGVSWVTGAAGQFSVGQGFSTEVNPSGPWSYGWTAKLGGQFKRFEHKWAVDDPPFSGWKDETAYPYVGFNPGNQATRQNPSTTVGPEQAFLHPGPGGECSVIRWTAPRAGWYRITGAFTGCAGYGGAPPTTTDVHVLCNGARAFDSFDSSLNLGGNGNEARFEISRDFQAGDKVDFVVGFGNGSHFCDTTGLEADVTPVPE